MLLALLLSSVSWRVTAQDTVAEESALRAAVVFGLLRFTSWQGSETGTGAEICLIGRPLSASVFLDLHSLRRLAERAVAVRSVSSAPALPAFCSVLILGPRLDETVRKALAGRVATRDMLTICDGCENEGDSMVTLIRADERIGVLINLTIAESAGVSFDSSLLELAIEVRR